ncbi:MAG: hypothetical protein BGO39_08395 [Chloroflexi bacterium 54-19]|nr:MAG: hypothetical protein BGO39_08395 [Chloroflexi bacterium 54-19]
MKDCSLHPIDQRLKEMGRTRTWLAKQIGKTPQCIGLYCNYKKLIVPESGFANLIGRVLYVDINYFVTDVFMCQGGKGLYYLYLYHFY